MVTMASKILPKAEVPQVGAGPDEGLRRVSHAELAAKIAARKAELGGVEVPRNSGRNRTASKRALLAEIAKLGGDW